jgi:thiamine phosphate synthase YjbQ (UPF0047 family)
MTSHTHYLWFETKQRQEIIDITDQVAEQVRLSGVREGLVLVSAMHISASVFVNDHESGLWHDILAWLEGTIRGSRSATAITKPERTTPLPT